MISEKDRIKIIELAKKYKVSSVYLFGSSLDINSEANDIDLGVKGIEPKLFFKFYGEILRLLSKSVDLVDLSEETLFNNIVEKNGVKIYG
jgi:predicted nucleotidyltransferase